MLKVKDVTVQFGDKTVLNKINLAFSPGEIVGLVAPNGTGKSTLINVIMNYLRPNQGAVTYGETFDYRTKRNEIKMHQRISSFPEQSDLYPELSGYDHLVIYARMWKRPIELVQTTIERLEMSPYVKKKTKTYSLGMKQRLCFAMQLVTDTEVMLMDEVMNGLDPHNTDLISKILVDLRKEKKTIIIASHLLDNLETYADRVLFLAEGEIIYERKYRKFRKTDPLFLRVKLNKQETRLIKKSKLLPAKQIKKLAPNQYVLTIEPKDSIEIQAVTSALLQVGVTNFSLGTQTLNELYSYYYID